jgi:hypothetical protein
MVYVQEYSGDDGVVGIKAKVVDLVELIRASF